MLLGATIKRFDYFKWQLEINRVFQSKIINNNPEQIIGIGPRYMLFELNDYAFINYFYLYYYGQQ